MTSLLMPQPYVVAPPTPRAGDATPIVRLVDVCKEYVAGETTVPVLRHVSVAFEPACFSAVAGPSGGGKSTLLNILGCLDVPTRGEYWLDGERVAADDPAQATRLRREHFGFVFQSFNLMPVLSALENVQLALAHLGLRAAESRARAFEMLDRVGLADRAGHRPPQLSGGQQQRVAVARALVKRPRIIFADEPTANLDEESTTAIVALMQRLNAEDGVSFIIATHDPAVYGQARRIYRMVAGGLQAIETLGGPHE